MDWIKHTQVVIPGKLEVTLRAWPECKLSFSTEAGRQLGIRNDMFAFLYFEPNAKLAGIRLLTEAGRDLMPTEETCGAIPIKGTPNNQFYVPAASFVREFEINASETKVFDLLKDESNGMLYFDLAKGRPSARKMVVNVQGQPPVPKMPPKYGWDNPQLQTAIERAKGDHRAIRAKMFSIVEIEGALVVQPGPVLETNRFVILRCSLVDGHWMGRLGSNQGKAKALGVAVGVANV